MEFFHYDEHTLYVISGSTTAEQIRQVIGKALDDYNASHELKVDTKMYINRVESHCYEPIGISYVYMKDPQAYYLLTDKLPTGAENVKKIYKCTEITEHLDFGSHTKLSQIIKDIDWAGDQHEIRELTEVIPLPPLITLGTITLESSKVTKETTPKETSESLEQYKLQIYPARVAELEPRLSHNILKCKSSPAWVTKSDVVKEFMFCKGMNPSRDGFIPVSVRRQKKGSSTISYPIIDIVNKDEHQNVILVTFNPNTHDAQFALLMNRKVIINKTIDGKRLSQTLLFTNAYAIDRKSRGNKPRNRK